MEMILDKGLAIYVAVDHEFRNTNPLYVWRATHKISRRKVASIIGVNVNSIVNWEAGNSFPAQHNMAALATMIGESTEKFEKRWVKWKLEKPSD